MHELAVCESILRQVLTVASSRKAARVGRITLRIGPLAGVEPDLLRAAFPLIAAGSTCAGSTIEIEEISVVVVCRICGSTSRVRPNRLLCASCFAWRVSVVSGDEMLLASVELFDGPPSDREEFLGV